MRDTSDNSNLDVVAPRSPVVVRRHVDGTTADMQRAIALHLASLHNHQGSTASAESERDEQGSSRVTTTATTAVTTNEPQPTPPSAFELDVAWEDLFTRHQQRLQQEEQLLQRPPIRSRICSKIRRVVRCLWFPVVFLAGLMTVITMVLFCVLPGIFVITIFFCCYYSCVRDPAPLSVWMIQLFGDDNNNGQPSTPRKSRHEMQAMLVTRRVVSIENYCQQGNDDITVEDPFPDLTTHRTHAGQVQLISTHGDRRLVFSDIVVIDPMVGITGEILKNGNEGEEDDDEQESIDFAFNSSIDEASETEDESKTSHKPQNRESPPEAPQTSRATADDENNDNGNTSNNNNDDHDMERPSSPISVQHSQAHPDAPCCDICLVEYQKDDFVCWSANSDCVHAFHRECILDWLERKPNCPNCRRSYLIEPTAAVEEENQDSNV